MGVWALKKPVCSRLHKITNEPVDYMAFAHYDFDEGQRHYVGNWKGWALKIKTFPVPASCHLAPKSRGSLIAKILGLNPFS